MTDRIPSQKAASTKQVTELTLLYQFSNTMLSTIRLNKLTHLVLTALTSGKAMLFDRAILFLRNEKTDVLQGMLGVTRNTAEGLQIIGGEDALSSHWDISEEIIALQVASEFSSLVRSTRIDMDNDCPVIKRVISEQKLCLIEDAGCHECTTCSFIKHLGATSFAATPLVAGGKSLGIIVVDNPQSDRMITQDNLHFLQLFANQAGMAIENSMLYNRVEQAHSSLREARERLVHGERLAAIGEMAANLAHELKNPLITIGGFAGRLLKSLPNQSREHTYADTIVKEVGRLEKMLSDILAFSRKPTICYSACNLAEILQDCFSSCAATLEDQGIRLSANLEESNLPLLGDAHQLKQVFLNLILNACEVMPDGGLLRVHSEISPRSKRVITIRISDTGGGIPTEMLSQIFNPFFTTKRHGTGLGLAIVNRILLNHDGRITAANDGSGAVFTVTLPLAETVQ
ncbi:MAG: GAF domain-containing protein [Geobacteraceae bacterium]|nr:GAF domain-containing protein [Geobacteraceae bacterium]